MRSIREQRERELTANGVASRYSKEAQSIGFEILTEDYPQLLDWAERIQRLLEHIQSVYGACSCREVTCLSCQPFKLLQEVEGE